MSDTSFIRPVELWRTLGLRAGHVVVHLGCGPGFYLIPAAKMVGAAGKAIGVDIRTEMLAEVENRARRENIEDVVVTVRANLEENGGSKITAASGDWVLVANILHQADMQKIIAEAKRIMRPGGRIVVVEWDVVATPMGPPAETRIFRGDVVALGESLGLVAEKLFAPSPYHYGIVFKAAV